MNRIILILAFIGLILSVNAQDTIAQGYCGGEGNGTNLTWILTSDSTLTISGSGNMANYAPSYAPWNCCKKNITTVVIGDSITSIGFDAFNDCTELTFVSIGNSVTTIEGRAFLYCSSLTSIFIPSSVTRIGRSPYAHPFAFCSSLLSINVDTSSLVYSSNDGILYNKLQDTLIKCPEGKTEAIIFSNIVTTIGYCAFENCNQSISINIPNTVITIEDRAFYCGNLTSITIGNSVTRIGELAFSGCGNLTDIIISNSVITIGSRAFVDCSSLPLISIPNSVVSIGDYAFDGCSSLLFIGVDTNNLVYDSNDGILYSKLQDTLFRCPEGKIGAELIPNSVIVIKSYAFNNCHNLTSVTIPNSVIEIGGGTFAGCDGLTSVIISIPEIGFGLFLGCSSLTTVTIGNSVEIIDRWAFYNCITLDTIICKSSFPPLVRDVTTFGGVPRDATVYIPCGSISYYQEMWTFSNYIEDDTLSVPVNLSITDTNNSFVLTWQGNAYSYNLYRNNELLATVWTTSYTDNSLSNGVQYCYKIQAVNRDCESEVSEEVCKIFNGTGTIEIPYSASISVYPNPTTGQLTISLPSPSEGGAYTAENVEIYNVMGQLLQSKIVNLQSKIVVDVSHLSNGMYFLKVGNQVLRFVKE